MTDRNVYKKVFNNTIFALSFFIAVLVLLRYITWPIRDMLLVFWVYGQKAYYNDGLRVLPGKPIRFSNGELASDFTDIVTGFGTFFVTIIAMIVLVLVVIFVRNRIIHRQKNG